MKRTVCEICGGKTKSIGRTKDWFLRTSSKKFPMYKCQGCGSFGLWPKPTAKDLAVAYPKTYWWQGKALGRFGRLLESYRFFGAKLIANWVNQSLVGFSKKKKFSVVELGCGTGTVLAAGRMMSGWRVLGVDGSREGVKVARKDYKLEARVMDLEKQTPHLGGFDGILVFHLLEHLREPLKFLMKINKGMNPGSLIFLAVPSADGLGRRLFGLKWRGFDVPRHLRTYSSRGLTGQLKRVGFRIIGRSTFSFRDDAPHLVGSLLPWADPLVMKTRRISGFSYIAGSVIFALVTMIFQPMAFLMGLLGLGETIQVVAAKSGGPK